MPRIAAVCITQMFRAIEKATRWPSQLTLAEAVHLAKTPELALDPLKYRTLLITSAAYPTWAKLRLRHLA
eukprot:717062-Alexandrium_andersonii.AAC.1